MKPPSVGPTPVRCKQPATAPVPAPPAADGWVDSFGRLSQEAATWIADLLGVVEKERALRAHEHRCLDEHEKRGLISQ